MPSPLRCDWAANGSELDQAYHDLEWGVPLHDETRLFEMLILEGAQAGLSWSTILKRRGHYRQAFSGFDPQKVARFTASDVERLQADAGIIRNRLKICSSVTNAQAFLRMQDQYDGFANFLWAFVDHCPQINHWQTMQQVPAETEQSRALSKALKKAGFKFVGPTICYAYMQACGLVNDHLVSCFRHPELS